MTLEIKRTPNILVIGDLMIDHYLWGRCDRISPEAPVQVVEVVRESEVLGGACNVMNNLVALGAKVYACGVLGMDVNGTRLEQMLIGLGVDCEGLIFEADRKTTKKSRVMASHQQVVRVDREDTGYVSPETEQKIIDFVAKNLDRFSAILLSDYGKGVLTHRLTQEIIALGREKFVLVDPKGKDYSKYKGAYLITPNRKEASLATGIDIKNDETLMDAGFALKNECDLKYAVITLSEDGMAIFDDKMTKIPTIAKEVYDVTGAGDTVLASLAFALTQDAGMIAACHFANSAAAVVVGKMGSATANMDEIAEYQRSLHKTKSEDKIKTWSEIEKTVKNMRALGKRVVFTNGCFDILHAGHVKYLEEAKSFGDVLILGLNNDESVKRLKGATRPINCEDDRALVLSALESVDFVVFFGEDTPFELIKIVVPDVLVKGGDYEGKEVVGSDIAKEVRLVRFLDGRSTTGTVQRCLNANN